MSEQLGEPKTLRVLKLYEDLLEGKCIYKKEAAREFNVSEKAIQRDIEVLRIYATNSSFVEEEQMIILYEEARKGYVLKRNDQKKLTNEEVLTLAKVLLESRAFPTKEMNQLLDKLIMQGFPDQHKHIREAISNERFLYHPVSHNRPLLEILWDLSFAVRERKLVKASYLRADGVLVERGLEPLGITFSEYYFYLIAYIQGANKDYPVIYRLDRIQSYEILKEHFYITDQQRFQEGEFRKQVQFMQTGKLIDVKFRFWGASLEAVMDRLPNAVVTMENDIAVVEAKVYGRGIKMWLLSQAQYVEVLKPDDFREEMKLTVKQIMQNYEDKLND